ncbi:MAG: bleomycin resistance protein [Microbacterium sp.]
MSERNGTEEPGGADEVGATRDAMDPHGGGLRDRAVPNLPSRDFDLTVSFYAGFGFEVDYRDGGWLILRRGGVVLEFFLAPELDPYSSWFMASIRIGELDDLYRDVRASGVPEATTGIPRLVPVALQEWGQRAGYLVDRDGSQLHLIEDRG